MPGFDLWLEDETVALRLQRSLPRILKRRENDDRAPAIISPRILSRGTPPSEPSAKLTRPHDWDRHARHPRRCRLELGLTLRLPSRRRRDNASSTHLTIGNRANQRLLRCTYGSVRYSEAGFETPAVVGNLSQSNATTGRVSGDTKSRWLFSPLGGSERRARIIVLPPRSTFLRAHVKPTTSRRVRLIQFVDREFMGLALASRRRAHFVRRSRAAGGRGRYGVIKLVELARRRQTHQPV